MSCGVLPIAHRGASGAAPENTKIAFVKAIDLGARAIEFDVQLTRDNVPIVFHDDTLERTTNGSGRVAETDFEVISKLDAGAWFSPAYRRVEVPTLEEILSSLGGKVLLNVELKPDERIERLVKHAVTAVARFDLFDSIVFSSFEPRSMRMLRRFVPEARLGILCTKGGLRKAIELAEELEAETIHPEKAMVDAQLIDLVHGAGRRVWAWTANTPTEIESLIAAGVDGIFSDFPDRVRGQSACSRRAAPRGV